MYSNLLQQQLFVKKNFASSNVYENCTMVLSILMMQEFLEVTLLNIL